MNVCADFCLIPMVDDVTIAPYIAAVQRVLEESGLDYALHGCGTNIEGPWSAVMSTIERCHEVVHQEGVARIQTTIRVGTRTDRAQTNNQKIEAVKRLLEEE